MLNLHICIEKLLWRRCITTKKLCSLMYKDPNVIQFPLLCRMLSPPHLQLPSRYSAPLKENPPGKSPDIKLTVISAAACRSTSQLLCLMNFAVCDISERNCSKYQCSPGSCQPTSQNLWPHLNFTLKHYNYDNYGITVSWEQPGDYIHDESYSQELPDVPWHLYYMPIYTTWQW